MIYVVFYDSRNKNWCLELFLKCLRNFNGNWYTKNWKLTRKFGMGYVLGPKFWFSSMVILCAMLGTFWGIHCILSYVNVYKNLKNSAIWCKYLGNNVCRADPLEIFTNFNANNVCRTNRLEIFTNFNVLIFIYTFKVKKYFSLYAPFCQKYQLVLHLWRHFDP